MSIIIKLVSLVAKFFGPSAGSIKKYFNVVELLKVAAVAIFSGGGALGAILAVEHHAGVIFPAHIEHAIAVAALAAGVELYRRYFHGKKA